MEGEQSPECEATIPSWGFGGWSAVRVVRRVFAMVNIRFPQTAPNVMEISIGRN